MYLIKLVRDKVSGFLTEGTHYSTLEFEHLDEREHVKRLRAKLGEEAIEYIQDPSLGELADSLEVIMALAALDLGVSFEDVMYEAARKRDERGSFLTGIGMYANDHPMLDGTPPGHWKS